jgi:hypothetical protein
VQDWLNLLVVLVHPIKNIDLGTLSFLSSGISNRVVLLGYIGRSLIYVSFSQRGVETVTIIFILDHWVDVLLGRKLLG